MIAIPLTRHLLATPTQLPPRTALRRRPRRPSCRPVPLCDAGIAERHARCGSKRLPRLLQHQVKAPAGHTLWYDQRRYTNHCFNTYSNQPGEQRVTGPGPRWGEAMPGSSRLRGAARVQPAESDVAAPGALPRACGVQVSGAQQRLARVDARRGVGAICRGGGCEVRVSKRPQPGSCRRAGTPPDSRAAAPLLLAAAPPVAPRPASPARLHRYACTSLRRRTSVKSAPVILAPWGGEKGLQRRGEGGGR